MKLFLPPGSEKALLAGGCFWGVQQLLRIQPGIIQTQVGYCGGQADTATYESVKTGTTGHAEAVQVVFDPNLTTFKTLLLFFFKMHDPTTLNQQGGDRGSQYRSVVFYQSEAQRLTALQVIAEIDASRFWPNPIVTQVVPNAPFYTAEVYHQDYLVKNPNGYTCHWIREDKSRSPS